MCHSRCKLGTLNSLANNWFWFRSSQWCPNGTYWRCLLKRDIVSKRTCACNQSNQNQYLARQRGEGKSKSWVWDISSQGLNTRGKRQRAQTLSRNQLGREKPLNLALPAYLHPGKVLSDAELYTKSDQAANMAAFNVIKKSLQTMEQNVSQCKIIYIYWRCISFKP